jgi:hypothetical protein
VLVHRPAAPPELVVDGESALLVDAGDPAGGGLTEDFDGNPRPNDGFRDGTAVRDMGAFEFQPGPPPGPGPGTTPPGGETPGGTTSPGGGEGGGGAAGAQTVTALGLAPKRFRAATRGAAITDAGARKPGTVVSFTVTRAGETGFSLERKATGRRSRGKCVKATRRNRKAKKCVRWVTVKKSAFTRTATTGANSFRLTGRLGRKALAPGGYRLLAGAGTSAKNALFTVLRPARKKR